MILTWRPSWDLNLGWYFLFCFDGQLHCFHFFRVNCTANHLVSMHRLVTEAWHTTTVLFDWRQTAACCAAAAACLFVRLISKHTEIYLLCTKCHALQPDWLIDWRSRRGAQGQLQGLFINSVLTGVWCGALKQAGGVFPQMAPGTNTAAPMEHCN